MSADMLLAPEAQAELGERTPSRLAIIDIGSNSIRLVVFAGPPRLPATLFNEKVLAGLGRGLAETGAIPAEAIEVAGKALARFALLAREMEVADLHVVATAAVRDASNGGAILEAARAAGLEVEILSGEEEAIAAGLGVLSAFPDADGIVGDLGGGSLELVRVGGGRVHNRASFPLGVLRIAALRSDGKMSLEQTVTEHLERAGWLGAGRGLPLYLVGGSWRALARLDMHLTGYPLPVIHGYTMRPEAIAQLQRALAQTSKNKLRAIPNLSSGRVPTLGNAAALLAVLVERLESSGTIASAYGLREGLLYGRLDPAVRAQDPLIVAAREEGRQLGRFPGHGDLLDRWIAPLFEGESARDARLRHAACLLADVGWRANPEFRAERGTEVALHGNWVGIDSYGRGMVAQALFTSLGGGLDTPEPLSRLVDAASLDRARRWGLAMRLGQRLSGGLAAPLRRSSLAIEGRNVVLRLAAADGALYGEAVERRHRALAAVLGLEPLVSRN